MYQTFRGVQYLHGYSATEVIGHFDLKPDNVMCTAAGVCKIADFGLAVSIAPGELVDDGQYRGTEEFMAPEVDESGSDGYGTPADIWSLGVMMFELVFGRICYPLRESWDRRREFAMEQAGYIYSSKFDVPLFS